MGFVVALDEDGRPLVVRRDRADLHLHGAAMIVPVDLVELRAGQTGSDPFDIEQQRPRLIDGAGNIERIV